MTDHVLEITGLRAGVAGKEILKGIDLTVRSGEVHAIMGPNGSGKSTLSHIIMGRPGYEVLGGTVTLDGVDVLAMSTPERAQAGLFLAMQYPTEVPGVAVVDVLEAAFAASGRDTADVAGRIIVEAGAVVINSTIRGPVAIGAGARIVDSFIGPFSAIGNDCVITNSEVEHSVIMARSTITDIPRLEDSLIGKEAVVARTQKRPRAARLMIGDHCQIDVE